MDNMVYKIIAIFFLAVSGLSLIFYIEFGWPLFFLLFIPALFFTKKPKVKTINSTTENRCISCGTGIDPNWKYCPFCSSKII